MATDASIVLKMVDQTKEAMQSAKSSTQELSKEYHDLSTKTADLSKQQDALRKAYADVSVEVAEAKKAVKEAANAFKESGDEADRANYSKAIEQYEALTDKAKDFKDALKSTRNEIKNTNEELRKSADETQKSADRQREALTGWGAAMSQWGNQIGGAITGTASYLLKSGTDSQTGNILTSILSGALAGGSAGLLTGNPIGVGIGAIIGGTAGLIEGITANAEVQDDAFREYSDQLVEQADANMSSRLTSGSATAAIREQNAIAFATLLGSQSAGGAALSAITDMANFTPYYYDDLVGIAKELTVYGYGKEGGGDLIGTLTTIGDAGAALGLSTSDMQTVAQQLGFLGKLNSASAVQLKQLLHKGLDVYGWLSEDLGVDESTLTGMISNGKISGAQAVSSVLGHMEEAFGGSMEKQATTFTGLESTIGGLTENLNAVMGDAYNQTRIGSMREQVDFLASSGMENVYAEIGEARALLENRNEAINRDVFGYIFDGESTKREYDAETQQVLESLRQQYLEASEQMNSDNEEYSEEAAVKMTAIYESTEALAAAIQDANESKDIWDDAALDVLKNIRSIVAKLGAYKDDWFYAEQRGKGRAGYAQFGAQPDDDGKAGTHVDGRVYSYDPSKVHHRATGQRVIPYDNYPILAHAGERLLSAAETRALDSRKSVTVTGNTFIVRQESDIDSIAQALAERIERAALLAI